MSNCNTICRLCRVNIKISGGSSINLFGEKSKKENILKRFATVLEVNEIVAVDGLSDSLCQKCYREFIKFEKHLEQKGQLLAFREAYENSVALSFNERKSEKRCANESPKTVNHEKKKAKSSTTVYRPLLPLFEQPNVAKEEAKENNVVNVENTFPDLIWPVYGENCTRTEVDYYFYT